MRTTALTLFTAFGLAFFAAPAAAQAEAKLAYVDLQRALNEVDEGKGGDEGEGGGAHTVLLFVRD